MSLSKLLTAAAKKMPPQVRIPADKSKVVGTDNLDKMLALSALIQKTEAQLKKRTVRLQAMMRSQTVFCPGCHTASRADAFTLVRQVKWNALEGEYESRSRNFICCPGCGTHLLLRGPALGILDNANSVYFPLTTNTSVHPVTTYFEHIGDEYRQFTLSEYS